MMWLMLQQDKPDDYVVATNETHSVKEFCVEAFGLLGLDWEKYVKLRRPLRAAGRSRTADRRSGQGAQAAGLGTEGQVQGAGQDHGRPRPGARPARVPGREAAQAVTKVFAAGLFPDRGFRA